MLQGFILSTIQADTPRFLKAHLESESNVEDGKLVCYLLIFTFVRLQADAQNFPPLISYSVYFLKFDAFMIAQLSHGTTFDPMS